MIDANHSSTKIVQQQNHLQHHSYLTVFSMDTMIIVTKKQPYKAHTSHSEDWDINVASQFIIISFTVSLQVLKDLIKMNNISWMQSLWYIFLLFLHKYSPIHISSHPCRYYVQNWGYWKMQSYCSIQMETKQIFS